MKYKRKKYIIHKAFQFRMLGTLLVLVLLATVAITLVNHFFFLSSIVDYASEYGRAPAGEDLFVASYKPLVIIIPAVFVVLAILICLVSHRIAGPLFRLKMYMEKVEKGDYTVHLRFRDRDAIHDVADAFNRMVEGIRNNFEEKSKK